jgi:hypothetical protein
MSDSSSTPCLNCGAPLTGLYCSKCGQKVPHGDLTLGELFHELTHELSHWDGKIPQTLKAMFFRPGLLTQDFLAGRRARWLPPLRLYLVITFVYFVSQPLVERITHRAAKQLAQVTATDSTGRPTAVTPQVRRQIRNSSFGRLFGEARLERAVLNAPRLNGIIQGAFPKAMFILLPIFALLTRIAWPKLRYPAHLYPALHLHSAWFGAFTVTTLATIFSPSLNVDGVIQLAAFVYCVWYGVVALHRIFGESWGKTIVKIVGIGAGYLGAFLVVSLGLVTYAIFQM